MGLSRLIEVREDEHVKVLAEHPDRIHPRALSSQLSSLVGDNHFKISLRRNIYVIYLYHRTGDDSCVSYP